MRKSLKAFSFIVLLFLMSSIFSFFTYPHVEGQQSGLANDEFQKAFNENYGIYSIALPESLDFAGESYPFIDEQIREAFDRELLVNTYWQSQTLLFLKRSKRYFPIIEPILAEYGIPEDFKYLPLIESGFMNVVSPAGAVGFWQLMEGTAKDYNLEVNNAVDERYHLEKATRVACMYLLEAKAKLGTWTLAAASYNMGIAGVSRQLERQRAESFFDLTLNPETARYLYRIMAVKEIISQPGKYGFHLKEDHAYHPIATVDVPVDSSLSHVDHFNSQFGLSYRQLKFHNPWLRLEYLPNKSGKLYMIKVPQELFDASTKVKKEGSTEK